MTLVSSWRSINLFERDFEKEIWVKLHKMRNQVMVNTSVQTNDLDMLICDWKMFLPMYFAMNKVNHARLALELFLLLLIFSMILITKYKVTQPLVLSKFFFVWKSKKSKNYLLPSTRVLFPLYWGSEKILIILERRFLNSILEYISCLVIRRYRSYYVNKLSDISKD